jgi:hypothetical protein
MVNVMPDIAQELQRVNDSISETLAITKVNAPETIAPLTARTEAGEEILKEASAVLEKKLTEELPAPPLSAMKEKVDAGRESVKKQMIALSATCSEITQPVEEQASAQGKPQSYVTYKDVELRKVSFTIERQSPIEEAILQYAKEKGEIDLEQCANELSVPHEDVERALENLGKKQRIVIQR